MVPTHSRYVIIGAGIHGLSTAWHLGRELRARGLGGDADILVLDKRAPGAGASGIACGTVRNNYFQPAMRELMAHSVSVWESDPDAFSYHPVGFLQIAPEVMSEDVAKIFTEQRSIGYPSVLIEGDRDCQRYLLDLFSDWQAPGITTRGGEASPPKKSPKQDCALWPPEKAMSFPASATTSARTESASFRAALSPASPQTSFALGSKQLRNTTILPGTFATQPGKYL